MGLRGAIISGVGLVVVVGGIFASLTTVSQGHVGVVYSKNGGVEKETLNQGWHWVSPIEKVTEYPIALETVEFKGLQLATKDGKPLSIDVSFNYKNSPEKVVDIFNKFKGAKPEVIEDTFIRSRVKDASLSVTSKYTILEIFQNREKIKTEISKKFTEDLKENGFIVEEFVLGTPVPDQSTANAIQAVVDAQQQLEALKVEKQKAQEIAEKQKIQAQGDADALLIKSKAEAEANKIINASLTPSLVNKMYIDKWDGKEPTTKVSGEANTSLMIK